MRDKHIETILFAQPLRIDRLNWIIFRLDTY